jgi:hypothetical protein
MPKINRRLLEASFFLYRRNPKNQTEMTGPHGTGCIVSRPSAHQNDPDHYYAVSNRHVVQAAGASIIRINTHDGRTRFVEKVQDDWRWVGDSDDLTIADITDDLNIKTDAVSCIPESGFVTERFIACVAGFLSIPL